MKQGGPFVSQGADADNIIEESAYDSNNEGPLNPQLMQMQQPMSGVRPHLPHQVGGKKKKGVAKGSKKKGFGAVKTNNFMVGNDL